MLTKRTWSPTLSNLHTARITFISCAAHYLIQNIVGKPPAAALFATHSRYKRESYRGSEFAPRILPDAGIQVVMKVCFMYLRSRMAIDRRLVSSQSDHPVLDSRFLLFEAQQAYYYGLPHNLALSAVTTAPATILGLDHRIGFLEEGEHYYNYL